jgi:hypothetical protein
MNVIRKSFEAAKKLPTAEQEAWAELSKIQGALTRLDTLASGNESRLREIVDVKSFNEVRGIVSRWEKTLLGL